MTTAPKVLLPAVPPDGLRFRGLAVCTLLSAAVGSGFSRADDGGADFFETKIRPVLVEHCYSCHSAAAKKAKGGLTLDTPAAVRKGGDSGSMLPTADGPGLLVAAVDHAADAPAMPPKGKLPGRVVEDFRRWAALGAPLPAEKAPVAGGAVAKSTSAGNDFWSFRPAREQPTPAVSDPRWPSRRVDAFILHKLDQEQMTPAPPADPRSLVRRVYFDLIGLPPTPESADAFADDPSPAAYERLVDELLASPRFGEKWGRHWLDVARYAEDNSTSETTCRPPRFPFRYRDWVIKAFNDDLPYDQFVRRQLAADLVPGLPPTELAALGFLGLAPVYHKEPKLSKDVIAAIVADEWDERVDTITRGLLGLTVACARCHDHKFDPITAEDYTALAGVMANTQAAERPLKPDGDADAEALTTTRLKLIDAELRLGAARDRKKTAVKEKTDPAPHEKDERARAEEVKGLREKVKVLYDGPTANGVRDAATWVDGSEADWTTIVYRPGEARDLPVFVRGNPARPGAVVPRRFLTALSPGEPKPFRQGSGRKELADRITGDAAGLSGRVFVNRVWGWLFGKGLVGTPSNFGTLGDKPTHPELLDDLSARFVAAGWSPKWLVRELVLSSTYRQSSRHNDDYARRDPDDRFLWRSPRKRLEVEGWRDAILQVSGRLDPRAGGPSDDLDAPDSARRTVYGRVSRQRPADVHRLFDLPDPKAHGEKRDPTTTPVQQLYFLNSPFVRRSADALVKRAAVGAAEPSVAVAEMYRRVLLREPTPAETEAAVKLVRPAKAGDPPAWNLLAQVLVASNEFLFLN